MFPSHQSAIQAELLDRVVAALPALSQTRDPYFLSSYAGTLLFGTCTSDGAQRLAAALERSEGLHPTALKFLRQAHQQETECVTLRQAIGE